MICKFIVLLHSYVRIYTWKIDTLLYVDVAFFVWPGKEIFVVRQLAFLF
jgi:hypothetical protein